MQISEFARACGVSRDTVRLYVRLGLLCPTTSERGGSRPYQIFQREHMDLVRMVKASQSLGMSLKEIALICRDQREGRMTRVRSVQVLTRQLHLLEARIQGLQATGAYLRAKLRWIDGDRRGPAPDMETFLPRPSLVIDD